MYEILQQLDEVRVTSTRAMPLTLAKCLHCQRVRKLPRQHVQRANRQGRKRCPDCLKDEFHYLTGTRIWRIWHGMVKRTSSPGDRDFPRYGGSGRGVSEDWLDFKNFYRDMADSYQDGLTLERINNSLGYSKDNCRWATNAEQQRNKVNTRFLAYKGETIHLAELVRRTGISRCALTIRLNNGMSPDEAEEDYRNSPYKKNRKPRTRTSTTS